LIPGVGILLLGELALHRNEPLSQVVQYGWWWYTVAVAVLLVIRYYRERWLLSLDRRFFRERYDANRLLENVVTQIKQAPSPEAVAQSMVQQIDEALHPEFVEVLMRGSGEARFVPVTGSLPTRAPLPASRAVIGLTELQRPLMLTPDAVSLRHQLSAAERAQLSELGIELIVPAFAEGRSTPVALIVLGPRRSEEPYNRDDLALLGTIAHALGLLMRPSAAKDAPGLSVCSSCGRCYDRGTTQCTLDGTALTNQSGSRLLNRRYRLERRLDRGGMGTVYEAFDEVLERKVAVKVIREELLVAPFSGEGIDPRERFRHEARTAAALTHINVVRIYDFGVDLDDRAFLVMELLEGETLRQRLQRDPVLASGEALHILQGVCSGLKAAHSLALVHRDLKPENIFLQRSDGRVTPKVLDFGLAKAFSTAQNAAESGGTGTGVLIGTLDYMAPEQILGDEVSPAWDVWALSVMAFEMLTGRHPFRSTSSPTAVDPDRALLAGNLPRPVANFFKGALSPDGSARPKDAMGFLSACEQVLV
jgi:eukaryotic-like serine/threonine-protein kinase